MMPFETLRDMAAINNKAVQKGAWSVFLLMANLIAPKYLDHYEPVIWVVIVVSGGLFLWMWKPWKIISGGWRTWASEEVSPQIPEIALVWDWSDEQKKAKNLLGLTDSSKSILVENRSDEWVNDVRIGDMKLDQTLAFDMIPEIAPRTKVEAVGRWNGRSSITTEYVYFFTKDENEKVAEVYRWKIKKTHNRGFQDYFLRLPFRVFFEWRGRKCVCKYELTYEQMGSTFFTRVKCESIKQ